MDNTSVSKQFSKQNGSYDAPFVPGLEHVLTRRELEICGLIAKGQNSWQIARTLHISEGTVKNHISSIFEKTDIRNRTELAAKYIVEYEQAVTDMLDLTLNDELLIDDFEAQPIAKLRLVGNNSLPNIIPLVFREPSFTIGRFDTSIGRKQCDFEFERATKAVSRRHAVIEQLESVHEKKQGSEDDYYEGEPSGSFAITDLNSRAGTFLNGERIPSGKQHLLKHGDQVSFGIAGADYIFEV